MAGERENNLFEGLDFSDITEGLMDSGVQGAPQENIEETLEDTLQEDEIQSKGDAVTSALEEVETEEKEASEDTKEIEENSSPLTPYAKLLVDEGILPNFNIKEFDGTADGLKEAMVKEINFGITEYKEGLPEEVRKILNNYEEGVPLKALLEIDERRFQYNTITKENIKESKDLQKAIIRDYYNQTTHFSEEKINKLIQKHDELEELEEEANNSLPELIKYQDVLEQEEVFKAKENQKIIEQNKQQALNTFKITLDKTNEVIPGIKLNKNVKDSIYKTMTTPVGQDDQGNLLNRVAVYRIEHPYEFDIMLSYLYETTKGFKDWSVLATAGKTKAIESFEEKVNKQNLPSGRLPRTQNSPSTKSIFDEIEKIKF